MSDQEPKPLWWVAARTSGAALAIAIGYTVMLAIMIGFLVSGLTSSLYEFMAVVADLLAALEWTSFAYLRKHRR